MGKKIFFPLDAKFSRILGIIRLLLRNDGTLSISRLTHLSGEHVDYLLPQIDAAKLLGIVRVDGDNVRLLNIGKRFYEEDKDAFEKVKVALSKREPFYTALELANRSGDFTIDELLDRLSASGVSLYANPEEARGKVSSALMQWAIHFDLLDYNGEQKLWSREKPKSQSK